MFDGFPIDPASPTGDVLISNDVGAARLKLAELGADKGFQDSLLDARDPRHAMRDRIWRALHVVASRKA
ncbi:MAG: hypothetical protein ACTHKQ_03475 [Mesorhizobium sp.]